MDALNRILGLVDRAIDQAESGQSVDYGQLCRRLDLETVRAGVETVMDAVARTREADEQLIRSE